MWALAQESWQFQLKAVPLTQDAVLDWRERPHDDIVLALAVAAWLAERGAFRADAWCFHFDPLPEPPWRAGWQPQW
jgi:hypothetical protein